MLKVHLGCGRKRLSDFVNVDIIDYSEVDVCCDIRSLTAFQSDSVDEIYASHVLEHFKRVEIPEVLKEWRRVLKVGGKLRIAVPDFDAVCKHVQEGDGLEIYDVLGLVYGGQTYEHNFHHVCFNFRSITHELKGAGFENISRYDWRTFLPDGFDDFSRAYLPHMDFERGRHMSLNIVGIKAR